MQASGHPKVTGVATQLEQPLSCRFMCKKETLLGELCFQVSCLLHNSAEVMLSLQRQWVASSFPNITPHCPLASGSIIVEFPLVSGKYLPGNSFLWHPRKRNFREVPEGRFPASSLGTASQGHPVTGILLQQSDLSWAVCFSRRNSGCFL